MVEGPLYIHIWLKITIKSNKKVIDYLQVTLDLSRNRPIYINVHSNHPPSVIKAVPQRIIKQLVEISSNEKEYNKAKHMYQESLE